MDTFDYSEDLQKIMVLPLFSGIGPDCMAEVLCSLKARCVDYCPGSVIVMEGDVTDKVGIILAGSAFIERSDYNGNRSVILDIGSGGMFGEALSALGEVEYPLSITALTGCRVLFLDSSVLVDISHPMACRDIVTMNLMRIMARKNIVFRQRIDILSRRSTREKLLCYLNYESRQRKTRSFEIPFDRQALADYLGVERSALSAVIGNLVKNGVILCHRKCFTIL